MAKSIISEERECYICGSPFVEEHHIYEGGGRRSNADKYGCKIYLCPEHHRGDTGVHKNRDLDLELKRLCQKEFESKVGTREEFMRLFRRNYL